MFARPARFQNLAFFLRNLAFLLLSLVACATSAQAPTARTANGLVSGIAGRAPGVTVYLGIPYAAPPVGALRWKPPQPAESWQGVRAADRFGDRCIQTNPFPDMQFQSEHESENCLTLSIWTPAGSADERFPVMVWIHGGGFFSGAGDERRHDGNAFAEHGVVLVDINYRLGVLGFLAHPELTAESAHAASGNYGLLDQIAALQWVHDNIAAFRGDPSNVTIFGESAGSFAVSALMASPLADGLFAKAIGESGAFFSSTTLPAEPLAAAEARGAALGERIGAPSIGALRAMPAAELISALSNGNRSGGFSPIVDGYVLPEDPWDAYAAGHQHHVPLLAGWNSAERKVAASTPAELDQQLKAQFPDRYRDALAVYPARDDHEAALSATALSSDNFIAYGTWKWIEQHSRTGEATVYRYLFDHPLPTPTGWPAPDDPGAAHASDIEFVFSTLDSRAVPWREIDRSLADLMTTYWSNFAKTGDPNGTGLPHWPAFEPDGGREVMTLSAEPRAAPAAHTDRFEFLDSVESAKRD